MKLITDVDFHLRIGDKMKKLDDRTYGFEYSNVEYEIIFNQDNMGFVRYNAVPAYDFMVYLDPYPGIPADEEDKEVFIIAKNKPEEGRL